MNVKIVGSWKNDEKGEMLFDNLKNHKIDSWSKKKQWKACRKKDIYEKKRGEKKKGKEKERKRKASRKSQYPFKPKGKGDKKDPRLWASVDRRAHRNKILA